MRGFETFEAGHQLRPRSSFGDSCRAFAEDHVDKSGFAYSADVWTFLPCSNWSTIRLERIDEVRSHLGSRRRMLHLEFWKAMSALYVAIRFCEECVLKGATLKKSGGGKEEARRIENTCIVCD